MSNDYDQGEYKILKKQIKRRVATAEGKRNKRHILKMNTTRCDTVKPSTSPKCVTREDYDFHLYKDDYYDKKNISPGYKYNFTYIGNPIKDDS
jgi:hypothetical protein